MFHKNQTFLWPDRYLLSMKDLNACMFNHWKEESDAKDLEDMDAELELDEELRSATTEYTANEDVDMELDKLESASVTQNATGARGASLQAIQNMADYLGSMQNVEKEEILAAKINKFLSVRDNLHLKLMFAFCLIILFSL